MKVARWLVALAVVIMPIASYSDTFAGGATFSDTSANNNGDNFTGSFATPGFNFSGGVNTVYTAALTINTNFTGFPTSSDNVSVNLSFTDPEGLDTSMGGVGTVKFFGIGLDNSIKWADNYQTVMFGNGASLQLYLPNFDYGTLLGCDYGSQTENLSMKVLSTATTPEPSSFALFGTGILCLLGALYYRKRAIV